MRPWEAFVALLAILWGYFWLGMNDAAWWQVVPLLVVLCFLNVRLARWRP